MSQATMRAALFERTGDATEVVELRSVPIPEPASGEVLVRMQAASIHPADRMFIAGTYRVRPVLPQGAGLVGAGRVVRCGAGVDIPAGTTVAFRHPGAWAEFCAVPLERLFVAPQGMRVQDMSQFALNPLTAWALLASARVHQGEWVAVNAARSNVAMMVRSLAERRGVRVVDIPDAFAAPGRLDVAPVAEQLLAATGGEQLAAVLDAVGGPALLEVMPAMRRGAVLVSYGLLSQASVPIHNADLIYRNLVWKGFGIDHWLDRHRAQREVLLSDLWHAISTGSLPMPVRAEYSLLSVKQALQADAQGGLGKVILHLGGAA